MEKGALEDYLTLNAKKIIVDSGFSSQKELKIIKLVEYINNNEIKLKDVIDVTEYLEAIIAALKN